MILTTFKSKLINLMVPPSGIPSRVRAIERITIRKQPGTFEQLETRNLLAADVPSELLGGDWYSEDTQAAMLESYRSSNIAEVGEANSSSAAVSAAAMPNVVDARLTVRVFDVDFACNIANCERDEVYLNGTRLTAPSNYLTGANNQWSTVSFQVDPTTIKQGANDIRIVIDILGAGWCLETDWGQLDLTMANGSSRSFRTDDGPDLDLYQPCDGGDNLIAFQIDVFDIQLKEAFAYEDVMIQGIGDRVYERSSGSQQPIADNLKNTGGGPGSFKLESHFDANGGTFPKGNFKVNYDWSIAGTSSSGTGTFSISSTDLSESIIINTPNAVGKYSLDLNLEIRDADGNVIAQPDVPDLDLYVTYETPKAGTPKLEWLQKGVAWAVGATNDTAVVDGVFSGIYNASGWLYRDVLGANWQQLSGLGGSSPAGNCFTFAYAWQGVSQALGVNAGIARTVRGPRSVGGLFVTKPSTSLDGITGNAHAPGAATDRWVFISHQTGVYKGTYYDPTFGKKWTGAGDAFVQNYAHAAGYVGGSLVIDAGALRFVRTNSPGPWGDWVFGPSPNPLAPTTANFEAAAIATTLTNAGGVDLSGDGIYDRLAFNIEIDAPIAGTYSLTGLVFRGTEFVTNRESIHNMIGTTATIQVKTPGKTNATILFSGEDIFQSQLNGPFTGFFNIVDPNGDTTTANYDTPNLLYTEFGEVPGKLDAVSAVGVDADANGKFEDLLISADITGRATNNVTVRANVYSKAGDFIGSVSDDVTIANGPQTVGLAMDGAALASSGVDGPYDFEVLLIDDQLGQVDILAGTTPAYTDDNFESRGSLSGSYNDYGVDTNANGFFDQLIIETDVTVTDAGKYNVEATLFDSAGKIIQTQIQSSDLAAGPNPISFSFDGRTISDHGVDGPYQLRYVALSDSGLLDIARDAFATSPYLASQFEPAIVSTVQFTNNFSDQAIDDNGDSVYDRLNISVEVNVRQAGTYDLNGRLLDKDGQDIGFEAISQFLNPGVHQLVLTFDGRAIANNGGDGPFSLVDLSAYLRSNPAEDAFLLHAYDTAPYTAEEFGATKNSAPVIEEFTNDAKQAGPQQPVQITARFTDVDTNDTHTATVDWGDGTAAMELPVQPHIGGGTVNGSHTYQDGGIYTITITVIDDEAAEDTATTTAVVTGVGLQNGNLYIIGSPRGDRVRVQRISQNMVRVRANFIPAGSRDFDLQAIDRIISYLGDGNDNLVIANSVQIPAIVYGEDGDDSLTAGSGPAVLLGGNGDDLIGGPSGYSIGSFGQYSYRDPWSWGIPGTLGQTGGLISIGGAGQDRIYGGLASDVVIGGSTNLDNDEAKLIELLNDWNSNGTYTDRVALIDAALTVQDDNSRDILMGRAGRDLFYDGLDETLLGLTADEDLLPST